MKTCQKCLETKPVTEFNRKADNRDGLQTSCKACDRAKVSAWQQTNKDRAYAAQKAWRGENRARWNAWMRSAGEKRRAAKLQRVPPWYDQRKAQEIYDLAAEFRAAGFEVDVDHIEPLQGELVSGLHVHDNLRVCLAGVNRSKGNRPSAFHA